jgi:hypothetical protein
MLKPGCTPLSTGAARRRLADLLFQLDFLRRHTEQAAQRHAQQHPADDELALPLRAHEALVTRHLARREPAAQALQLGVGDRVRIHHPERSLRHLDTIALSQKGIIVRRVA